MVTNSWKYSEKKRNNIQWNKDGIYVKLLVIHYAKDNEVTSMTKCKEKKEKQKKLSS